MIKGLLNEVHGTLLEGAHSHRDVPVAGDEDDRQSRFSGNQMILNLQAAHALHAHVQKQDGNCIRVVLCNEAFAAVKELVPDGLIVVNNVNRAERLCSFRGRKVGKSHGSRNP